MELIPLSTDAHRNKGRLASRGLPGLRGQTPEDLAYLFLKVRKGEMPQNVIEGPPVDTYPKRRRPDSAQSWSAGEIPWRSEATRQRAHLSKKTLPEMMLNPKLISACDLKRSSRLALGRVRAYRGFDPSIARRRAKVLSAVSQIQRCYRGWSARQLFREKRKWHQRLVQLLRQFVKLTLQAMAFNKWAEARSLAVIRIQASVRSFLGLKEARTRQHERRRRHGAATKIQALHRGNAGRAACIHRRRRYVAAVLVIQRCARIFLARAAVENKALEMYLRADGAPSQGLARRARRPVEHVAALRDASLKAALERHAEGWKARSSTGRSEQSPPPTASPQVRQTRRALLAFSGGSQATLGEREAFEDAILGLTAQLKAMEVDLEAQKAMAAQAEAHAAQQRHQLDEQRQAVAEARAEAQACRELAAVAEERAAALEPKTNTEDLAESGQGLTEDDGSEQDADAAESTEQGSDEEEAEDSAEAPVPAGVRMDRRSSLDLELEEHMARSPHLNSPKEDAGGGAAPCAADAVADAAATVTGEVTKTEIEWLLEAAPARERRQAAGQVIKACYLAHLRGGQYAVMNAASMSITQCMRRHHCRKKMAAVLRGLEGEAKRLSDTHMHELDKVLSMEEYFGKSGNRAMEKLRLAKCILKHRKVVRQLFMAFSTLGVSDVKKAFRVSKLQWVNFCIEAEVGKSLPEKTRVFSDIFTHCNHGTEPFLPPYQSSEDSFLVMYSFLELMESNATRIITILELNQGETRDELQERMTPELYDILKTDLGLLREIYAYFSSLGQLKVMTEAREDLMNVVEFMTMADNLQLCDLYFPLQKCIEICLHCNHETFTHYLHKAMDPYFIEEKLQIDFETFLDSILQMALLKKEGMVLQGNGKPVEDSEAVFMTLRLIRQGWKQWDAQRENRAAREKVKQDYIPHLLGLGTNTVQKLPLGQGRISIITPENKRRQERRGSKAA